ncbi:patatin-like phospholipase family protein [Hydrogenophaga sp.]|uniref:patatin-like phospholipase family protein n=1 Tax=Hydrogenophaga sp. TaxID=1904254 RepID=UPI00272187F0|nr:patatin-like phospholipase family protein [Hydrogenophaga sp.]MDO9434984.1 patatin-like phospholipase family protein [Hydrogenophaga sp.]
MPTPSTASRTRRHTRAAWLFIAALLCALTPARAQAPAEAVAAAPTQRPRVGLVLSGGGARGFAHVGVLKALEAAKVPVDLIVGTSMGAIIGGLYASGMSADELEREILGVRWGDLFDRREPRQLLSQRRKEEDFELSPVLMLGFRDGAFVLPSGAVSTRSLEMLLRRYTLSTRHLASFDGLPTPFRAVATDMETGQPVVMDHGDLAAALRASMSVPGVFSPLSVEGRILGDGGLVNNLPIDVARRMGADVVIAVNIGTPLAGRETLGSVVGITTQMVNILTEQNVQASIATLTPQDLLLAPPLGTLSSSDFGRATELVQIGNDYARTVSEALKRFSVEAPRYAQWVATREAQAQANTGRIGTVASIKFEGVSELHAQRLATALHSEQDQRLDVPKLERDLQSLSASGDYERVDYSLARRGDGAEDLTVHLRENTWGPNYLRVGLDLRTDFEGQGAFNLRISHNRHWLNDSGAEWRNRVQLGETLGLYSELYQPLTLRSDRFVAGYVDYNLRKVEYFTPDGDMLALLQRQGVQVGVDVGMPMGLLGNVGDMRLGLVAARRKVKPVLIAGVSPQDARGSLVWSELGVRAAVLADQLDYANFPSQGYRAKGEVVMGRRSFRDAENSGSFTRMEGTATAVKSWGPHTLNVGARVAYASQIPIGALDEYALGGFQQMSGYRTGQLAGNYLVFGRITYYQRLPYSVGVARALFVGGSLEAGNAWAARRDISFKDMRTGSSLFVGADTGIGPLYLSIVSAPRGYTGLYLFLGRP